MRARTWAAAALAAAGVLGLAVGARADDVLPLSGGDDTPTVTLEGKGQADLVPTAVHVRVGRVGVRVGPRVGVRVGGRAVVVRRGGWWGRPGWYGWNRGWWGYRPGWYGWGGYRYGWYGPRVVVRRPYYYYYPAYGNYYYYPYPVVTTPVINTTPVVSDFYYSPTGIRPGVTPSAPVVGTSPSLGESLPAPSRTLSPPAEGTFDYDGGPTDAAPAPPTGPVPQAAPPRAVRPAPLRQVSLPASPARSFSYRAYGEGARPSDTILVNGVAR